MSLLTSPTVCGGVFLVYSFQVLQVNFYSFSGDKASHISDFSLEEFTFLWPQLDSMVLEGLEDIADFFQVLIE